MYVCMYVKFWIKIDSMRKRGNIQKKVELFYCKGSFLSLIGWTKCVSSLSALSY